MHKKKKKSRQVSASVTRGKKQTTLVAVLPHQHADLQLLQQLLLCHLAQSNWCAQVLPWAQLG